MMVPRGSLTRDNYRRTRAPTLFEFAQITAPGFTTEYQDQQER